ncbi:Hpt domain-containing protein [Thiothrix eikelboomii]|uniref:HPt (Histidine-containing phosphotransfer) domain-containing protein n=1 Tax=Thiothrix eikelboomii TaxID=92487 RepID=A0A1T4VX50_9GAMM|nr:Hpt domain-containing protein [Thiothrix eikelboomii]SKA69564.1 HPt (histidine-containing phosphotransfer) domain-containing protein [Thiothrix eikelboomii]
MTSTTSVIDKQVYNELQDIMAEGFTELVEVFRADTVSALSRLEHCVAQADAIQVGCICHKLKSSSKLIGAFKMAEWASLLETYKDDHNQARAQGHLQALLAEYAQVKAWLDADQPSMV